MKVLRGDLKMRATENMSSQKEYQLLLWYCSNHLSHQLFTEGRSTLKLIMKF